MGGGEDWQTPRSTRTQLTKLQGYARLRRHAEVFEGVFVADYYHVPASREKWLEFPLGFRLDDAMPVRRGLPQACRICGTCEANASQLRDSDSVAGCYGWFSPPTGHRGLGTILEAVLDESGLRNRVSTCFLPTRPIWYGLWAVSPLDPEQCEILYTVFSHWPVEPQDPDLGDFVTALRRCLDSNLPLHVEHTAPGHTDMGWITTFPHCPRCKAESDLPRWHSPYPKKPVVCKVCGQRYIPSQTASAEREEYPGHPWDLRKIMSEAEFEGFLRRYLLQEGHSEVEIDHAIRIDTERRQSDESMDDD